MKYRNYQTGNERAVETETCVDVAGTALVVIVAVVVGVVVVVVVVGVFVVIWLLVVRGWYLETETGIVGPGHHPIHLAGNPRRGIGHPLQPLQAGQPSFNITMPPSNKVLSPSRSK